MPGKNSSPDRQDQRLSRLLEEALGYKIRRDFAGAVRVLLNAVEEYPDAAAGWGLLGSIYWCELGKPKKAIPCLEKAVRLSPRSELASLGLFHSLWQIGKQGEALEEMKRFQTVSHSKDYDEILAEILGKCPSD